MKEKISFEIDMPDGYEFVGYGKVNKGGSFLSVVDSKVLVASTKCIGYRVIVKKKEPLIKKFICEDQTLKQVAYGEYFVVVPGGELFRWAEVKSSTTRYLVYKEVENDS